MIDWELYGDSQEESIEFQDYNLYDGPTGEHIVIAGDYDDEAPHFEDYGEEDSEDYEIDSASYDKSDRTEFEGKLYDEIISGETMKGIKIKMKCGDCGKAIDECDGCTQAFKLGDKIICGLNEHCCCVDCFEAYTISEAIVEDASSG